MEQFALFEERELPTREKTRWEELEEMNRIARTRGTLLPMATAAEVLDVCRQRLHQLTSRGRIELYEFLGKKWVCEADLHQYAEGKSERIGGRGKKAA